MALHGRLGNLEEGVLPQPVHFQQLFQTKVEPVAGLGQPDFHFVGFAGMADLENRLGQNFLFEFQEGLLDEPFLRLDFPVDDEVGPQTVRVSLAALAEGHKLADPVFVLGLPGLDGLESQTGVLGLRRVDVEGTPLAKADIGELRQNFDGVHLEFKFLCLARAGCEAGPPLFHEQLLQLFGAELAGSPVGFGHAEKGSVATVGNFGLQGKTPKVS